MYNLTDIVSIVTGASNGIGAALVRNLVKEGAKHVRILDVDDNSGVLLQEELNQTFGNNRVKFVKCDVSNEEQLFGAFSDVTEEYGYIDLLINNAGVAVEDNSAAIRREIDVNLTATVNGTIRLIELMRKDKGGKGGTIINVSSIAALMIMCPMLFVYGATKSGILHFSTTIGAEPYYSSTGVRVLSVCFGNTETAIVPSMKSYDEVINKHMQDVAAGLPAQTPDKAAVGTIEAFKKGESGSTWIIQKGEVQDITPKIKEAYNILSSAVLM